ncbi:DNA-3-methyladenine glycosylase 2 family protein [Mycetocola manganoxydans]|uniref:DNA-3-methyladenine glycosylase 2 family protein n=1 Tax=Mycetocola manganoxydans TaxID=699879 RepID=A0A3L6ZV27_9MICO|nr:DNA-3-methyladenine glycosylase 2 family protein [Mycetocola manganoxydans]RLP71411.1 DNA-3-methyladenine glycosylase 2 family protein [Mycetocola manganoxydans]GHD46360.1 3-methyladenine DNA glycosylase [Mycetocola manganoxydans]
MDAPALTRSSLDAASSAGDLVRRERYAPRHPLQVQRIVSPFSRGGDGPCFRRTTTGAWITMRTPAGPATLHLAQDATGVDATAWGPGAEWSIDGVPELLGARDDWSDIDLSPSPLLSEVHRRNPGLRLGRNRLVFEMLAPAILEQKVTVVEAWAAWRLLVRRHGTPAPGPAPDGMVVAPDADTWRHIPSWEWHTAGVGPQRSETAVRASRVAAALERTITGTGDVVAEAAEASVRLRSLPGIGPWTAAEVTSRAHGDPDAVSVGDYHLASTVGMALTGSPVDDDAMLELLEPWAGQRQRVLRLILLSGIRKPRRGPKITIQDHRRH